MKVKTFTGSETAKVDKRVNDWLAQFGIRPHTPPSGSSSNPTRRGSTNRIYPKRPVRGVY